MTKNAFLAAWNPAAAPTAASGSADDPAFPASKLLSDDLFDSWRSAIGSLSGVRITLTLPAPTTVSYAALIGANLNPLSATRRLELAQLSDPGFAADLWDSGTAAPWDITNQPALPYTPPWGRNIVVLVPSVANVSFARWTLADPTPGILPPAVPGQPLPANDNYLRASIARIGGDSWQPSPAPWNAGGVNFDDAWEQAPVISGDAAAPICQRGHKFNFKAANEADQAFLMSLQLNQRGVERLIVIPRPLNTASWLAENAWCAAESASGSGTAASASSPLVVMTPLAGMAGKAKSVQIAFREVAV